MGIDHFFGNVFQPGCPIRKWIIFSGNRSGKDLLLIPKRWELEWKAAVTKEWVKASVTPSIIVKPGVKMDINGGFTTLVMIIQNMHEQELALVVSGQSLFLNMILLLCLQGGILQVAIHR